MLQLCTTRAHRAYILSVESDVRRGRERVTLLIDYGENQARLDLEVRMPSGHASKMEAYRRELRAIEQALTAILRSERSLRWADQV